jgi:hypothetical protein
VGSDELGSAVAATADVIVAGARGNDDGFTGAGSAYVFERNVETNAFEEVAKLVSPLPGANDFFGAAVAIHSTTVVVGSDADSVDGLGANAGTAHVFEKNSTTGDYDFVQTLLGNDAAASDRFGLGIALSDSLLVIGAIGQDGSAGATGAAYVFERNSSTGLFEEVAMLDVDDGVNSDFLGQSVATSGDVVVVGAPPANGLGGVDSGAVYIFKRNASTDDFDLIEKLVGDDVAGDFFGTGVAIDNGYIIVSAPSHNATGAVFVYTIDAITGAVAQVDKLFADDPTVDDQFGSAVALAGSRLVVGAKFDHDENGLADAGSAYVFDLDSFTSTFVQTYKLTPDVGTGANFIFGAAVAVTGPEAVVGSPKNNGLGTRSGAVYVIPLL